MYVHSFLVSAHWGWSGGLIGDCRLDSGRSRQMVLPAGVSRLHCNWQNGNRRSPPVPVLSCWSLEGVLYKYFVTLESKSVLLCTDYILVSDVF